MMKFRINSLKFEISVLAMLILAFLLVIYSGLLLLSLRHTLYQELDESLSVKAQKINNAIESYMNVLGSDPRSFEFAVERVIAQRGEHPHKNKIEKLENLWLGQAQPLGLGTDRVLFLNSEGQAVVGSDSVDSSFSVRVPKNMLGDSANKSVFENVDLGKEHLRAILMPVRYENLRTNDHFLLLVATSRERVRYILHERLMTKIFFVLLILVISSFLSQLFAKRILKPVEEITQMARSIRHQDLSKRIHTEGVDIEMKELAEALNDMMSRLERSFKFIAEFSSHVSHELKTPLAILRGESELALRSEQSAEEYRRILKSNLEEIARMGKIIEDLLLLTKIDYQPDVFKFEEIDFVEFFKEIRDSAQILAEPKKIKISLQVPNQKLPVKADKVHLRRLFFNLINNAIKFTYPNGEIMLGVKLSGRQVLVSVTDNGVGISAENIPKVFDKFFHYNSQLTPNEPTGNGLGLSIALSIAKIHSGDIHVQSIEGKGSTFTVQLPALPA